MDLATLESRLKEIQQPLEASKLYSTLTETKFVDESLRRSSFRAIVDPTLFTIADQLVQAVNATDPLYKYQLVRNDVTEIVYQPGGFFQRHQDYLSLVSNVVEEFTMIICITAESAAAVTVGGETVLHLSSSATHVSQATTSRGHALVFRKDLPHEGRLVEAGEKRIVTLNLWGTRKRTDDRIVHVTFAPLRDPLVNGPGASDISDNTAMLRSAVAKPQSYALSVSTVMAFPDSVLARKVSFESAGQSGRASSTIIPFLCEVATFDEFAVVYSLYQRFHVSAEVVSRHLAVVRFFGFADEHMLVDMLVDMAGPPQDEDDPSSTVGAGDIAGIVRIVNSKF